MQPFMRLYTHDIIAIQQPVQLLAGQGDHLIVNRARPFEAGPLQALLPQAEAVALPLCPPLNYALMHFTSFAYSL